MPVPHRRSGVSAPASGRSAEGYSAGIAEVGKKRAPTGPIARLFGYPDRIIGLDIARGIAFLVLVAFVFARRAAEGGGDPIIPALVNLTPLGSTTGAAASEFIEVAGGALGTVVPLAVVVISGIAIGRSAEASAAHPGVALIQTRLRLVLRAALLLVLAAVLEPLGVPYAGLLGTLGILSCLAALLIALPARALLVMGPVWLIVASAGSRALATAVEGSGARLVPPLEWLIASTYSPLAWAGLFIVGLGVGRLDLRRWRTRLVLAAVAGGCIALTVASRLLLSSLTLPRSLEPFVQVHPSSAMPLALVGAGGAILLGIALCLCAGDALRWLLVPFSAIGSQAASCGVLVLGLVVLCDALGRGIDGSRGRRGLEEFVASLFRGARGGDLSAASPFVALSALVLVAGFCACFAVVGRLAAGDGPIERLVGMATRRLAGVGRRLDDVDVAAAAGAEADAPLVASATASPRLQGVTDESDRASALTATPSVEARRRALVAGDPVVTTSRWTPGQSLGKLPY